MIQTSMSQEVQKDVNHFIPLYTVFTVHVQCDTLSEPITFSVNAANSTLDCRRPHTQASADRLGGEIRCTFVKVTRFLSRIRVQQVSGMAFY